MMPHGQRIFISGMGEGDLADSHRLIAPAHTSGPHEGAHKQGWDPQTDYNMLPKKRLKPQTPLDLWDYSRWA
jgi:hypothetical protein